MGFNIKNIKVENQLRELAELTGEGLTEAVEKAVAERLARLKNEKRRARASAAVEVDQLVGELNALPVRDTRTLEDMLYDERGLPK
jgi:antitoxin VapB